MAINVFAAKYGENDLAVSHRIKPIRFSCLASLILSVSLIFILKTESESASSREDLNSEIDQLLATTKRESIQNIEVINAISFAVAPPLSLTVGTVAGSSGKTVDIPVYFKEGSSQVSSLQFDVPASPRFSVTSVVAGIAAQAAGKSVESNQSSTGTRVIIFGLNQTALSSGPVVILKVMVNPSVTTGKTPLSVTSLTGSNPAGLNVPLTGNSGSITVK